MPNYLESPHLSRSKIKTFTDQFFDRGDPSVFDYSLTDFTTDGNWHDLDLSALVPYGPSSVLLVSYIKDDLFGTNIAFRTKSNANEVNISSAAILVANIFFLDFHIITCNANPIIQYKCTNTTWTDLYLAVRGWWI